MFLSLQVEQELDKGALQLGTSTGESDKAAAADLGGQFEAEEIEAFADFDMVLRLEVEGRFVTPNTDFRVSLFVFADGAVSMGKVRNLEKQFGLTGVSGIGLFADRFDALTNTANLRFNFRTVFAFSLEHSDFLGDAIAVSLKLLLFGFAGSTFLVAL